RCFRPDLHLVDPRFGLGLAGVAGAVTARQPVRVELIGVRNGHAVVDRVADAVAVGVEGGRAPTDRADRGGSPPLAICHGPNALDYLHLRPVSAPTDAGEGARSLQAIGSWGGSDGFDASFQPISMTRPSA